MASEINYSFPPVPLSITNPSVRKENALDSQGVFSFLEFIKTVTVPYDATLLQEYYNNYLKTWYKAQGSKNNLQSNEIVDRYRDFLRDISLNYTTNDEKKFLSNIDFNNSTDLAIAISFYSRKLKEIANYYREKRDTAKYALTKAKLKGSNFGTEKTISELVITYLENRGDIITYDIDDIKARIEVDLQELYDGYGSYFNSTPDNVNVGHKDLDYGENIFLLSTEDVVNKLFQGLSEELKQLKEVADLIENKKDLTKKYIGSSFFYLSSNSLGETVSGSLFTADDPSANFLNRNYPSTASVFSNILLTKEEIGFFKPSKTSIITVEAKDFNFSYSPIEPDTLIFFPDPKLYGNDSTAFTFNVDPSRFKRSGITGLAKNQPNTSYGDTSFFGYVSEVIPNIPLGSSLDYIFDQGYIDDSKKDIFGNIFGLVKDNNNFKPNIIKDSNLKVVKNLQLNGYQFFDTLYGEGLNYNYSTFDDTTYTETIRSGLSTFTNSFTGYSLSAYYLMFRYFVPYQELIAPTFTDEVDTFPVITSIDGRDAAYFTFSDSTLLPDTISSDLSAFPGSGTYYFSELYEAGVYTNSPIQRALLDPLYPLAVADFTKSVRLSGANGVLDIDGGLFTQDVNTSYIFDNDPSYYYYPTSDTVTTYETFDSVQEIYTTRKSLSGHLYVKNSVSGEVKELTQSLSYIPSRYNASVVNALSTQITEFDLLYNTLFLQTSSYLVIDKPVFEDGIFSNPKTSAKVITFNTDAYNKISNRFKQKNEAFYFVTKFKNNALSATTNQVIYPEIYKYDYLTDTNSLIFPINDNQLNEYTYLFNVSGGNILYLELATPRITYNSRNNLFNCSWLLKDQNKSPYLFTFNFNYTGEDVEFKIGNSYVATDSNNTYILSSLNILSQFQNVLSSSPVNFTNNTLIL